MNKYKSNFVNKYKNIYSTIVLREIQSERQFENDCFIIAFSESLQK